MSVGAAIRETIAKYPDQTALWVNNRNYTYKELSRLALAIARRFEGERAQKIAVFSDRNEIAYAAILSAVLAGKTYVPLNPRFPLARTLDMINQSGTTHVVCDERCAGLLKTAFENSYPIKIIIPKPQDEAWLEQDSSTELRVQNPDPEEIAYIIFTSGTTGKPKAVPVTAHNLLAYVSNISRLLKPRSDDRFTQSSDFTFDFSVHDIFTAWTAGATVYSISEGMAPMMDRFIRNFEITICSAVPSSAAIIKSSNRLLPGSLPSLRHSIFGGEALAPSIANAWKKAAPGSTLINMYGPTEATVAVTTFEWQNQYESQIKGPVPLGFAFPDQKTLVVDECLKPVAAGEVGELIVSGSQVTSGYLNNPAATTERYVHLKGSVWYRTGDHVVYDEQFGFQYRGRVDHQIKVRGFRVESQEVEAHLRAASGSDLVAVVGFPQDPNGLVTGLIAYVVSSQVSEEEVLARCKKVLPDYMVPSRMVTLAELPLNAHGKIDYMALDKLASALTSPTE